MSEETRHETRHGALVFSGDHVYEVTAATGDGQSLTLAVAADDEWKARTRFMAAQDGLALRGQDVTYEVREVR